MKRGLIAILAVFLLLVACAPKEQAQPTQPSQKPSQPGETIYAGTPSFKLIVENAKRNPATVYGTIKNIGNGTGTAKVTARIYYSQVIVDEKMQTVENVQPGQEANFSISMNQEAQFNSFKVSVEVS